MSNYLDALCGNVFSEYLSKVMPLEIEHLSNYPDFLAFFLVAIITGMWKLKKIDKLRHF